MKKLFLLLLAVIIRFSAIHGQDYSQPVIPLDSIYQFQLENGLTVMIIEDHQSSRVLTSLFVHRPADSLFALAELVGKSLLAGNKKQSAINFRLRSDSIGLLYRSFPTGIQFVTKGQRADSTITFMADMLNYPDFSKSKIDSLSRFSSENTFAYLENSLNLVGDISDQLLEITPTNESLEVDSAAVVEYFDRKYRPDSSLLVIIGDVRPDSIQKKITTELSDWKGKKLSPSPRDSSLKKSTDLERQVALGHTEAPGPAAVKILLPLKEKARWKTEPYAELINVLLGGHPQSRLNKNLRIKNGFSYGLLSSLLWTRDGQGFISIQGGIKPEYLDSALVQIITEVDRLRTEPVKADELALAQRITTTNFSRKLERPVNVAEMLYRSWIDSFPKNFYAGFNDTLRAVKPINLLQAANRFLGTDSIVIIAAGDKYELENQLLPFADSTLLYFDAYANPILASNFRTPADMSTDKILSKYLDSISITLPIDSIKSLSTTWSGEIEGTNIELNMKVAKPDKLLIVVKMDGNPISTTVLNGDQIWMSDAGNKTGNIDSSLVRQLRLQALIFPETVGDSSFVFKGVDIIRGKPAYRIAATQEGDPPIYHYATQSGLKVQTVQKGNNGQVIKQYFSDYKAVKGIRYPHSVIVEGLTGWPLQFALKEIEINPGLSEELFLAGEEKN